MRIEQIVHSQEEAIYTVEFGKGLYVDVKSLRKPPYLVYVMQNEDGTVVFDDERNPIPTECCYYNDEIEKTVISLIAMEEQGRCDQEDITPVISCPFCRKLADIEEQEVAWRKSPRYKPGYEQCNTVALVTSTTYEGEPSGRVTAHGYPLNFCPVCGKVICESNASYDKLTDKSESGANEVSADLDMREQEDLPPHDPARMTTDELKMLYDSVAPELDPEGFKLFWTAESILGKIEYSHFAYEENCGIFEDADGNELLAYLLVQHCTKLGEENAKIERWVPVANGYERCIDLSMDKCTAAYICFERKLYIKVLQMLGVIPNVQ